MSAKQGVIFAFMLVFLAVMLTALSLWFYFALELNIKEKAIVALKYKKDVTQKRMEALKPAVADALEAQISQRTSEASSKYQEVFEGEDNRYKRWQEKEGELKKYWGEDGEAAKAWKQTYEDWTKRNVKIKAQADDLKVQTSQANQRTELAHKELEEVLKAEDVQKKTSTAAIKKNREDLDSIRRGSEDVQDRITKQIRTLTKSPAQEVDGYIIHSAPDLNQATVDLGSQHGAKTGMRFQVYDGRYKVPMLKGEVVLTKVNATSSIAVILPPHERAKIDPTTGWEAPDPTMRYSPLTGAGADGTEIQALENPKTKKDLVEELLKKKRKQENPEIEEALDNATSEPPVTFSKGFNPIVAKDWIANSEFIRILPAREFNNQVKDELGNLKDINIGVLTFFVADTIPPFRREFLRRLCERNRCKTVTSITPDVDIIVSTPDASSLEMLEERLKLPADKEQRQKVLTEKAAQSPDLANRARTYEALLEGKKWGVQVLNEEELENFFVKRQRKVELAKGNLIQPGQHVFYIVGETKLRSNHETSLYIKELGGVVAPRLDPSVDYIVVGAGLTDAKMDVKTGRIYYGREEAPADALPFFDLTKPDVVRTMGLKVLREEELAHFFGLE